MDRSEPFFADGDDITSALLRALGEGDRESRARTIARAADEVDPDVLVGQVADPVDAVRRNAAMDALARAGRRSVPALVKALDANDDELVMFSAGTLGRSRDRSVIPHLVRLLAHRDANVVQTAIEGLGFLRARAAVEPLLQLLDGDPWVRLGAIHALGEIGDVRAVEPLARRLGDADAWSIAAEALGKLRSLRAVAHLADALFNARDHDFDVPLRALGDALRRGLDPALLAELDPWMRLRRREAREVHVRLATALAPPVPHSTEALELAEAAAIVVRALRLDPLYPALLRGARNPAMSSAAQLWTLAIGQASAGAIAECLVDTVPEVRALACRCAGVLHLISLAPRLVVALRDSSPAVRSAAATALAHVRASDAAPAIAALLLDEDAEVAAAASSALVGLDPAAASAALLALPRDGAGVLTSMLRAMSARPHADQLSFVLDALRHGDPEVRRLAVEALAAQRGLEPVDALLPALSDAVPAVRTAAIRVLSTYRDARVREALLARLPADPVCGPVIVDVLLAAEGPTIAPQLVALFWNEPRARRTSLLESLAALDTPALEPLVVDLMTSPETGDRRAAVRAMGRRPTSPMRRLLLAAATDTSWEVRLDVAEQLVGHRGDDILTELERLSLDDHPLVQRVARHALERVRGE